MGTLSPQGGSYSETTARTSALVMHVLRAMFILAVGAVGWTLASDDKIVWGQMGGYRDLIIIGFVGAALIVVALDLLIPRKSLSAISGLFFGLVVGLVVAYGLSLIIDLLATVAGDGDMDRSALALVNAVKLAMGVTCCYLAVSFIMQTKDDVRFVIPYVEFAKETKGARPLVLDTSVIIDGRIADIAETRIIESEFIVPRFVLHELQSIADSPDKLKRVRGRRGLDMLNKLQGNEKIWIRILEVEPSRSAPNASVDEMLIDLALQLNGRVVTNDFNLSKLAQLRGVTIININDLANALKPVVLPGESLSVKVIKPGEEIGQGVGYLDDGTMVVAEGCRDRIGEVVQLAVTSVLQTSAGRMIFGRPANLPVPDRRRTKTETSGA